MDHLDCLRKEGSHHDDAADAPIVLNKPIAPYIEDLFRWNKQSFGHQRLSKEVQATVCYNCYCFAQ